MTAEIARIFVTSTQRQLLWTLIQFDTANTIYSLVVGEGSATEKTTKIVNQLDFLFEIRVATAAMPAQGGQLTLNELGRAYLSALLDGANEELLSPEIRAVFARDRDDLQMKLGDLKSGFLVRAVRRLIGPS